MKSDNKRLREAIRNYAQKLQKENKQADANWIVDKIASALDAATNDKKDYQMAAAAQSDAFKDLAKDLKGKMDSDSNKQDEVLKETFFDWLAGGAKNYVHGILDRRAGYLQSAMKNDAKLQRMAREAGLSGRDFENKIYSLMQKDTSFLKALASGQLRARGAGRF
jgi:hypothetical protein